MVLNFTSSQIWLSELCFLMQEEICALVIAGEESLFFRLLLGGLSREHACACNNWMDAQW